MITCRSAIGNSPANENLNIVFASFGFYSVPICDTFVVHKMNQIMQIEQCTLTDTNTILSLYEAARNLQIQRQMVVWPVFEKSFIEKEINEKRQYKIIIDDALACNWTIAFEDKDIWGEKDKGDAIYIHRICTHSNFRGNRFIKKIVDWAKHYASQLGKQYLRLDTLGNNTKLIEHYTATGFKFLGMSRLTNTVSLPAHYQQEPNCCFFELKI